MLHGLVAEGVLCGLIAVVVLLQDGVIAGDMIVRQAVGFIMTELQVGREGRIYWFVGLCAGLVAFFTMALVKAYPSYCYESKIYLPFVH